MQPPLGQRGHCGVPGPDRDVSKEKDNNRHQRPGGRLSTAVQGEKS